MGLLPNKTVSGVVSDLPSRSAREKMQIHNDTATPFPIMQADVHKPRGRQQTPGFLMREWHITPWLCIQ